MCFACHCTLQPCLFFVPVYSLPVVHTWSVHQPYTSSVLWRCVRSVSCLECHPSRLLVLYQCCTVRTRILKKIAMPIRKIGEGTNDDAANLNCARFHGPHHLLEPSKFCGKNASARPRRLVPHCTCTSTGVFLAVRTPDDDIVGKTLHSFLCSHHYTVDRSSFLWC